MSDRLISLPPPPRWIRPGRRPRRLHIGLGLGLILVICLSLGTNLAHVVVRPGPLASPHAQILQGTGTIQRCAACHTNFSTTGAIRADRTDSPWGVACLACHDSSDAAVAFSPHGLPRETWGLAVGNHSVQNPVGCNACHREHRGADADLTAISDARCQSCHQERFASLGQGHPDFALAGRPGGVIEFDHQSHRARHFPAGGETGFDCRACHLNDSATGDPLVTTLAYDAACGRCHDASLRVAASTPLRLLEVPEEAGGQPPPPPTAGEVWTRWLCETPRPDSQAVSKLIERLATEGQTLLLTRLTRMGSPPEAARRLAASVPPQLITDAADRWFGPPGDIEPIPTPGVKQKPGSLDVDLAPGGSLLAGPGAADDDWLDPLTVDPLLDQSANDEPNPESTALPPQPMGGWSRDDLTLSLQYRGASTDDSTPHADPVLKSLVEIALHSPPSSDRDTVLRHPRCTRVCNVIDAQRKTPGNPHRLFGPLKRRRSSGSIRCIISIIGRTSISPDCKIAAVAMSPCRTRKRLMRRD